jgi:hypothetical protein
LQLPDIIFERSGFDQTFEKLMEVFVFSNRHPGAVEHGQKAATGHDYDPSSVLHHLSGHNPAVVVDGTYRCNVIATHQPGKVLHMGAKYGALFFCHFTDYS